MVISLILNGNKKGKKQDPKHPNLLLENLMMIKPNLKQRKVFYKSIRWHQKRESDIQDHLVWQI
jgi:hypothetical protein